MVRTGILTQIVKVELSNHRAAPEVEKGMSAAGRPRGMDFGE
jgi:hypothetical protein